jgi:hypothetical protein
MPSATDCPETPSRRVLLRLAGTAAAAAVLGGAGLAGAPQAEAGLRKTLKFQTLTVLNVRAGAGTSSRIVGRFPKGKTFTATGYAANGWIRLTYRSKTAYVSNKHVRPKSLDDPTYTSTRNGLPESARYFTRKAGTVLRYLPDGAVMAGDLPAGAVAWHDAALEARYGATAGWRLVRTAGMVGWVRASALRTTSPSPSLWGRWYSSARVRAMANGKLASRALVAIPWDPGRNLVAGPALGDLTRLNRAFRARFGTDLEIDLTYRTRGTQEYLYRELGPYIAARPGTSNHGWGFAIDFPETYGYSFRGRYYKWLKANSAAYGWVHRRNLEEGSPYAEAWHFEYVR